MSLFVGDVWWVVVVVPVAVVGFWDFCEFFTFIFLVVAGGFSSIFHLFSLTHSLTFHPFAMPTATPSSAGARKRPANSRLRWGGR
jgi:hypothetical protein